MKYLSLLKSENTHQGALSKLPEPPFDSFGSEGRRHFPEKKAADHQAPDHQAPIAVVDIDTPTGPRTVHVTGNHAPALDLPIGCPLLGGPVPDGCRFESKLFRRMVAEGILLLHGGRCPLGHICRLEQEKAPIK